jgi:hypothetical protein
MAMAHNITGNGQRAKEELYKQRIRRTATSHELRFLVTDRFLEQFFLRLFGVSLCILLADWTTVDG